MNMGCTAWLLAAGCAFTLSAQAPVRTVALTFDDLPAAGTTDGPAVAEINRRLLQALDAHHAPATGFVIGQRVEALSNADRRWSVGRC